VGRWSLLALGIVYGINRNRSLSKKEAQLRIIEEKERPAKEAAKAAEKARLNRGNLLYMIMITVDHSMDILYW